MTECLFKPGDVVRLVSEPRVSRLDRLIGQPSIVTHVDTTYAPPRVIVAVFDPTRRELERIRCRTEDLERVAAAR